MRILVVEDDPTLCDVIARTLRDAGHAVDVATEGNKADAMLALDPYDAVVLDLNLPGMDGLEVLSRARRRGVAAPVLVITARDTLDDRIRGLDAGSDDYLVKPFDLRELEARLRALLRRGTGAAARVEIGSVVLDTAARRVFVSGEPLALPPREFALLEALMLQPGKVVSKAKLATQLSAWGDEPLAPNALEVFVHRLRKKLEHAGLEIRTMRGMGYMIEKPDG
ncbi:MAG: response regulator transcription factor [Burkholderiales bacterium]|jgi:DNA-binding response OmpR family regulator|nr:response regulator transcription factor [Burkholderiales bacterium]